MSHILDSDSTPRRMSTLVLPDAPALVAARGGGPTGDVSAALLLSGDGEVEELSAYEALDRLARSSVIVVNSIFTARRISLSGASLRSPLPGFREPGPRVLDLLELFAFVHPAIPCLPTPGGLARALNIDMGEGPEAQAMMLHQATRRLLTTLQSPHYPDRPGAARVARRMAEAGWAWGAGVMAALADVFGQDGEHSSRGFDIWNDLPDWEDSAPRGSASSFPVEEHEARTRLSALTGPDAEPRKGQSDFAAETARAFSPRDALSAPNVVIAEAGTGIGKTLGYIAPASLWAERNKGTVWLSTYTKNLQRQLDQELSRLYPDPAEKAEKAVVRKGRENYLCLLNYAEMADRAVLSGGAVAIGLVARWARASRDGDMVGGDFPAWLAQRLQWAGSSFGGRGTISLTDRRGECVYSACPHFKKCFIEKAIRKARKADIVVANHALVMRQAALDQAVALLAPKAMQTGAGAVEAAGNAEDEEPSGRENRSRFVFDEGHHIFDAADGAFSAHLSASETAELRRWIRGAEGQRGRRGRGLAERISDLIANDSEAEKSLAIVLEAAAALPAAGWDGRIRDGNPRGATERFLSLIRQQVHARSEETEVFFSLEAELAPAIDGLEQAALELDHALERMAQPLLQLAERLRQRLDAEAEDLDTSVRIRLDGAARGLERRARILIPSWRSMLGAIGRPPSDDFIDWFSIDRIGGREIDIGMHRHWRDPTIPFAESVLEPAHGVVITSATLRDQLIEENDAEAPNLGGWESAEIRTGVTHLPMPVRRAFMASPFNYQAQARVYVVRDVSVKDADQVAAAYRELFLAAGGGALGLFTAVHRLRAVHERIAAPLEQNGVSLYAQHVDALDTGTLVDIFRSERHACLLGTDAVRDGVDVPGDSLRMIVFDRTPWPRPDILHKARRARFGAARYDDMLTRLRLKQAFGRLIRSAKDRGVFIMLDSRLPTRLTSAFPPGTIVHRVGLAEAIAGAREFLNPLADDEVPF